MILIILMKIINIISQKELGKKIQNLKLSQELVVKVREDFNLMLIKKADMHKLLLMMKIKYMFN